MGMAAMCVQISKNVNLPQFNLKTLPIVNSRLEWKQYVCMCTVLADVSLPQFPCLHHPKVSCGAHTFIKLASSVDAIAISEI